MGITEFDPLPGNSPVELTKIDAAFGIGVGIIEIAKIIAEIVGDVATVTSIEV